MKRQIYKSPRFWEQETTPVWLPVSVAAVKKAARMDSTDTLMDDSIGLNIEIVTSRVEAYCGIILRDTKFTAYYDDFPVVINIQKAPFVSLNGIAYVIDDVATALDLTTIQQQVKKHEVNIFPTKSSNFPSTDENVDSVSVDINFGYIEDEGIPKAIQGAIMTSVVAMLFGSDEDCSSSKDVLCGTSKSMLKPFKNSFGWMAH